MEQLGWTHCLTLPLVTKCLFCIALLYVVIVCQCVCMHYALIFLSSRFWYVRCTGRHSDAILFYLVSKAGLSAFWQNFLDISSFPLILEPFYLQYTYAETPQQWACVICNCSAYIWLSSRSYWFLRTPTEGLLPATTRHLCPWSHVNIHVSAAPWHSFGCSLVLPEIHVLCISGVTHAACDTQLTTAFHWLLWCVSTSCLGNCATWFFSDLCTPTNRVEMKIIHASWESISDQQLMDFCGCWACSTCASRAYMWCPRWLLHFIGCQVCRICWPGNCATWEFWWLLKLAGWRCNSLCCHLSIGKMSVV